jgi:hypothetical protein
MARRMLGEKSAPARFLICDRLLDHYVFRKFIDATSYGLLALARLYP